MQTPTKLNYEGKKMTRTELIENVAHTDPCPYDKADLIDRIANKRLVSAGQSRYLATLAGDTAVSVETSNPSDEYVIVTYSIPAGQSHEEMCRNIRPRVHQNASWCDGTDCTFVTYED